MTAGPDVPLLGAAEIRELAARHGIRPTKQWGQNFVVDGNTVRRIVRVAGVGADDTVVEVGPGLGSLTLALLPVVDRVVAVEVDPVLAGALPETVAPHAPDARRTGSRSCSPTPSRSRELPGPPPTALVANLPYNVSVPVVLRFLELLPERCAPSSSWCSSRWPSACAAGPGSKTYGVPSVKAAWYADVRLAGQVSRSVFWPVPNVDSGLVALTRREQPADRRPPAQEVFACVDAAFAQRRKTLRAALAAWAGSPGARRGGPRRPPASTPAPAASSSTSRRSRRSPPPARQSARARVAPAASD